MAIDERSSKKRKQHAHEEPAGAFDRAVGIEMLSDEEGGDDVESDNGEVDEFPEIDPASDSEDEEYDSEEDEEEDDENDEDDSSDDELHIFPKGETIVSDVTGHPKRVYPEIEPDYDSDSSTEDVRYILYLPEST